MAISKERRNHLIRLADKTLNAHLNYLNSEINKKEKQIQDSSDEKEKKLLENEKMILEASKILRVKDDDCYILDSYNGQVASLSVSIAMSGLLPTLAIFYQDGAESNAEKAYRRNVLDVVAMMIMADKERDKLGFSANDKHAYNLMKYAVDNYAVDNYAVDNYAVDNSIKNNRLTALKQEIIECAIALKQVVRTYNLV